MANRFIDTNSCAFLNFNFVSEAFSKLGGTFTNKNENTAVKDTQLVVVSATMNSFDSFFVNVASARADQYGNGAKMISLSGLDAAIQMRDYLNNIIDEAPALLEELAEARALTKTNPLEVCCESPALGFE